MPKRCRFLGVSWTGGHPFCFSSSLFQSSTPALSRLGGGRSLLRAQLQQLVSLRRPFSGTAAHPVHSRAAWICVQACVPSLDVA